MQWLPTSCLVRRAPRYPWPSPRAVPRAGCATLANRSPCTRCGAGRRTSDWPSSAWIGMPLLSYTATRGWAPDAMQRAVAQLESRGWIRDGGLTDEGLAGRLGIEQRTDAQEQPIAAEVPHRSTVLPFGPLRRATSAAAAAGLISTSAPRAVSNGASDAGSGCSM